ncbi:TerC/Alx family metal homeostasis membrane protein [Conexibacter sp. CPCC 206217]|uniref:TerC/Alx family metal homeostasis membrane protein n=1 Tax=Conexibacter sp. CPCC 206217 TaxID=3064574 RepID=UPI00272070C7|nr:TerC/Alx family metal homeostasis membrane protein [Conexibacter sp. CPCC 206217]MDO8213388.1 TerC/Alx family metal homeostasis membrane protein [Conexibacter sp. CPCC 206217]
MLIPWLGLVAFIVVSLTIDLRGHGGRPMTPRNALIWSIAWTAIGAAFAILLLIFDDGQAAGEYLSGFLIEKSLSLDNLFVFAILFTFLQVPDTQRLKVLVWGIAGAIVLRTLFILVGAAALDAFHATTYVLGALLLFTAIRIAKSGGEEMDPERTIIMRMLRRALPLSREFDGDKLFTIENGKRLATPLFAALALVAAFDVMFAIDSIPAIFAITRDTYIVFAANAFSLLGMVSLYFLLDGLLDRFRYLHYGLAVILAFVAAKLLLVDVWHPSNGLSLAVIAVAIGGAALFSSIAERREQRLAQERADAGLPPLEASDERDEDKTPTTSA